MERTSSWAATSSTCSTLSEAGNLEAGDPDKLEEIDAIRQRVEAESAASEEEILGLGGLYVLGTERHEARRIDNQLGGQPAARATSARAATCPAGSPDADLLSRLGRERDERLGMSEGQPSSRGWSPVRWRAQKKVEDELRDPQEPPRVATR